MSEIDRTWVGTLSEPFEVELEAGAIRKFARAIGDANPLYHDARYAQAQGYPDLPAPPTFPTCFRPPQAPRWMTVLDRRRIVAGETEFEYLRPLVAGMRLQCQITLVAVEDKQGSKGAMQILRQAMACRADDGELLAIVHRSTIYRSLEQIERGSLA
jgi:acyl dehydratase